MTEYPFNDSPRHSPTSPYGDTKMQQDHEVNERARQMCNQRVPTPTLQSRETFVDGQLAAQVEQARHLEKLARRLSSQTTDIESVLFGGENSGSPERKETELDRPAQPYVPALGEAHELAVRILEEVNDRLASVLGRL